MRGRLRFLDIARVLSVFLVAYGHFVSVGGLAPVIPGIIGPDVALPLFKCENCSLESFELTLIIWLHTQSAVLGVSTFFMITGFLIPSMLDRYTRTEFLLNRVFRIFPALIAATLAVGAWVGVLQGVTFSWTSYLSSVTLSYPYVQVAPIMGVLWTLIIEVIFYVLAAALGAFDLRKILILQGLIAAVVGLTDAIHDGRLLVLANELKYIEMILVGSVLYVSRREGWGLLSTGLALGEAAAASVAVFWLSNAIHYEFSNYGNLSNHLAALAIILALYASRHFMAEAAVLAPVYSVSEMVYPIYLVHAAVGLSVMGSLKALTDDPLALIVGATLSSLAVAALIHRWVEAPGIAFGRRAMQWATAAERVDRAAAVV